MNPQLIHTLITVGSSIVVTLGGVFGIHKLSLKRIEKIIPEAMKIGGDVLKGTEDLIGLPGMKTVKGAMDVEVHHIEGELEKSQILQVVGSALHAFGKSAGSLSNNESAALVTFAQNELSKLGVQVDAKQIESALKDVQKLADTFGNSDLFKTAQKFDALQQKPAPEKKASTKKEEAAKADTKAADKKEAAK